MDIDREQVAPLAPVLLALALAASCAAPRIAAKPAAPPPPVDRSHGKVSLQIIPDPKAHPPEFEPDEQFVPPRIIGAPLLPEYPPDALAAKAAPATVVLRITIGASGRVEIIEDSPVVASTAGPFADEFRWAAVRAIRRWQFSPGRIDRVLPPEPGDAGDGPPVERIETGPPIDVFYDLRFDFEIVDGVGRVRSSVAPGADT